MTSIQKAKEQEKIISLAIEKRGIVRTCIERNCVVCGKSFFAELGAINRGGGKYCSRKCYYASPHLHKKGIDHPNYRDGGRSAFARYKAKNQHKIDCRSETRKAIKRGDIIPKPCEVCGAKAEIHHYDYSNCKHIRWLCRPHHLEAHKQWCGSIQNIFAL